MIKENTKVKIDIKMRKEYLNMMLFYIEHPDIACEDLIGIKLTPHESLIVDAYFRGVDLEICEGRAMAKSFTIAVISLLITCFTETTIGIWSGSDFRGGKNIFSDYLNKMVAGDIFGQDNKKNYLRSIAIPNKDKFYVAGSDKWVMRIGKSNIITAPVNNKIRGFRTVKNFFDERNTFDDTTVRTVINPFQYHDVDVHSTFSDELKKMLPLNKAQSANFGTPRYNYETWTKRIIALMDYYKDDNYSGLDGKIFYLRLNFLDSYKHAIEESRMINDLQDPDSPIEEMRAEILAEPIRDSCLRYYPPNIVENLPKDSFPEHVQSLDGWVYSMGVDMSEVGFDKASITLVRRKPNTKDIFIVNIWEFDTSAPNSHKEISDRIKKTVVDFPSIEYIAIDQRGGGVSLKNLLLDKSDGFGFGIVERSLLKNESGDFKLDSSYKAIAELLATNDILNTELNDYVKTRFQMGQIHIINTGLLDLSDEDNRLVKMTKKMLSQFGNIVRTQNKSKFFNFSVPSGKKKDTYSSTLYSIYPFMMEDKSIKINENKEHKSKLILVSMKR